MITTIIVEEDEKLSIFAVVMTSSEKHSRFIVSIFNINSMLYHYLPIDVLKLYYCNI